MTAQNSDYPKKSFSNRFFYKIKISDLQFYIIFTRHGTLTLGRSSTCHAVFLCRLGPDHDSFQIAKETVGAE